jgi:hypothetical protein
VEEKSNMTMDRFRNMLDCRNKNDYNPSDSGNRQRAIPQFFDVPDFRTSTMGWNNLRHHVRMENVPDFVHLVGETVNVTVKSLVKKTYTLVGQCGGSVICHSIYLKHRHFVACTRARAIFVFLRGLRTHAAAAYTSRDTDVSRTGSLRRTNDLVGPQLLGMECADCMSLIAAEEGVSTESAATAAF